METSGVGCGEGGLREEVEGERGEGGEKEEGELSSSVSPCVSGSPVSLASLFSSSYSSPTKTIPSSRLMSSPSRTLRRSNKLGNDSESINSR